MADDSQSPGDTGPERIDIEHDNELQVWADKLDVTPDQIRQAVQAVGPLAADVEMHLKGTRSITNAEQGDRADEGRTG
jgi:hypothetical protein